MIEMVVLHSKSYVVTYRSYLTSAQILKFSKVEQSYKRVESIL